MIFMEVSKMKIGIVGFGNLGRSLASGLVKSGCVSKLYICETFPDACKTAECAPYHAHVSEDINFVIRHSDVIFIVVKSYVFEEIARLIDSAALANKTIVSFMAGMGIEQMRSLIGNATIVRAMPSLAIAECEGVIGYTAASAAVSDIFSKLGYAFETEPENIEKVMAFAACGLGFAAYLIDAFAATGTSMGFSPETSANIATLTFKNAVERGSFRQTVKSVATPGGATEQGILHFDECGVYDIVEQAVRKAYDRMV